jgi:hypothetical protein
LGIDVNARPKRHRTAKLRAAVPAAFSVFRELMRRPVGATVVVLVPRTEHPAAPEDQIVFDDQQLRAS